MTNAPRGRHAAPPPRTPHPFTHEIVDALVYHLKGLCIGLEKHAELSDQIDPAQSARWAKELDSSIRSLHRFSSRLKEYNSAY